MKRIIKSSIRSAVLCSYFIIALSTELLALGDGIKLWDVLTIRPTFKAGEQFDTNVYLNRQDPKRDFVTNVAAGADAEMRMQDLLLTVGYLFDMNLFAEHDDQNNYNHTVNGSADWKLTNYEIILKDKYRNFSDRSGTENTERLHRQNNVLSADLLTKEFDRLAFDVGYDFTIEDYLSDEIVFNNLTYSKVESRQEHFFRGEGSYRFMPKTSVLAEADFGVIDYFKGFRSDSYAVQALTGIRGEPFNGSVADIKAGFRYQDYESTKDRGFVGMVANGSFTKELGAKDGIALTIERSVNESTYANMNYYILNFVSLGYVHQFNDKWSANLNGSYQLSTYPEKTVEGGIYDTRVDHFYAGGCGLRYDIKKWLTTEVSYQYTRRNSRFTAFNYTENLVSASGLIKF